MVQERKKVSIGQVCNREPQVATPCPIMPHNTSSFRVQSNPYSVSEPSSWPVASPYSVPVLPAGSVPQPPHTLTYITVCSHLHYSKTFSTSSSMQLLIYRISPLHWSGTDSEYCMDGHLTTLCILDQSHDSITCTIAVIPLARSNTSQRNLIFLNGHGVLENTSTSMFIT